MDPITFKNGPITYKERVELLQMVNKHKSPEKVSTTRCLKGNSNRKAGRPRGSKNKSSKGW